LKSNCSLDESSVFKAADAWMNVELWVRAILLLDKELHLYLQGIAVCWAWG